MNNREDIIRRRESCERSAAHYHAECKRMTQRAKINWEYVMAECSHPPEAVRKIYRASHFVTICEDCCKEFK